MKIVVPKRMPVVDDIGIGLPWFFIGGPIRGGGDWQAEFCLLLQRLMGKDEFVAVVPCRWDNTHRLSQYFVTAEPLEDRQTVWERAWLEYCGGGSPLSRGVAIFFLAKQVTARPPEEGVYARDTLGEIGEWRGRLMYDPKVRLVIGADPEFDQNCVSIMQCNFKEALRRDFRICESMLRTAQIAVAHAFAQ